MVVPVAAISIESMENVINLSYITNQGFDKGDISNIATTKYIEITPKQGLGQARPNKKLSQKGKNFQELKICGHGTILALTKTHTF